MIYFCCDERRRQLVRDPASGLNGIDFLEVLDTEAVNQVDRQRYLYVHFLKDLTPNQLDANNILIEGGERIRGIQVVPPVMIGGTQPNNVLTLEVNQPGDYSIYRLRLVQDAPHAAGTSGAGEPPAGIDPVLSLVSFSFKVECPSDFDCAPERICPPETTAEPEIDYLAKDYNSFRQLMLDRMSVVMPEWRERNAADEGIALVELLAYVGDHLSYEQDAIATEAYLDTARRRVSVRRHAKLVDYFMHDGCNARTWVQVQVSADDIKLKQGTRVITRVPGVPVVVNSKTDSEQMRLISAASTESFETMQDATFFIAHNTIEFYTWAEERCCLPAGATMATLKGDLPNLQVGDVLIFEEVAGPETGDAADANPAHRHAVRLTKINRQVEVKNAPPKPLTDPLNGQPCAEIEWHNDDALPFALCLSALTDAGYTENISVARGNIVLADHGFTLTEELGAPLPPDEALAAVSPTSASCCDPQDATPVLPPFRPQLAERPVTQKATLNLKPESESTTSLSRDSSASASAVYRWDMRDVLPDVSLLDGAGRPWHPQRDLLSSDEFAKEFVAEIDDDGYATLRFGDDQRGLQPAPGVELKATYRVGNGKAGNIGAEALVHLITAAPLPGIESVRNPMPAQGGAEPETMEHVRRMAPQAFRIQERAVTSDDYAEVARRHREVQNAAATVRWTGSWRTIFLTIDRLGGRPVDADFEQDMRLHLERYRMAGHDVEIDSPRFVSLEVEMTVCVKPEYFRSDVKAALLRIFSNKTQPDGQVGVFHPDNFSFGQPVYLSKLYAAAQKVEGVRFVTVTTFRRLGTKSRQELDEGVLKLGALEVARLDNDPNFAERGVFRLTMEGGK
jgi:Baseplate J-like protein